MNKNLNKILFPHIIAFLLSLSAFQKPAHSNTTKWEDAKASLSQLLDSGWQVTAFGTNRVAANSNAGNGFDVKNYSFLLIKSGKYIICILENPGQPVTDNKCRRLN
jgi:hypothetical protein